MKGLTTLEVNMGKVKFGKFESISGLWDDYKTAPIVVDGEQVGELTAVREDVGGGSRVIRTVEYSAELWIEGAAEIYVPCEKTGTWEYDWRAALKQIKQQVREALA